MTQIYVKKRSGPSYSLDDLDDVALDVANQNMTFRKPLTFEEVLELTKQKLIKKLNRKRENLVIRTISVEFFERKIIRRRKTVRKKMCWHWLKTSSDNKKYS